MPRYGVFKRVLDVALATILLLLAAPLLLLLVVMVKTTSKGPAIYRQKRVGKNGRVFTLIKLRSMKFEPQTPIYICRSLADERLTGFGKLIRATHLDEIPQFINVIKGDMSLVGPRPHPVEKHKELSERIPSYGHRTAVRPGMTGLAKVRLPLLPDAEQATAFDMLYIKSTSLWLDIKIMALTVPIMLQGARRLWANEQPVFEAAT
ncbi:MAG TPA: sugar transferase [Candidatus Dormibacteraeota bacterium]|nr:sugar transferase [Candidatus Dormibacteraeota bacterium]